MGQMKKFLAPVYWQIDKWRVKFIMKQIRKEAKKERKIDDIRIDDES